MLLPQAQVDLNLCFYCPAAGPCEQDATRRSGSPVVQSAWQKPAPSQAAKSSACKHLMPGCCMPLACIPLPDRSLRTAPVPGRPERVHVQQLRLRAVCWISLWTAHHWLPASFYPN
jgi:hypothetical protein